MAATTATARKVSLALRSHVNAVLLAKTHANVLREKINAIHAEVLDYLDVRDENGERITDPTKAWSMDEKYCRNYYAECDKRNAEAGYKVPASHCPALIAEELQRVAERNLVDGATEFFPEVTADRLLCASLEKYRQYVDLLIKLVVNAPGYVAPKL